MRWLSQGAPREITGGAGKNGRVPQKGTNNSQEKRTTEFSQGSEDFKEQAGPSTQLLPIYGINVLPVNSWNIKRAGQIVRDQELQRSMKDRNAHIENVHLPKEKSVFPEILPDSSLT